MMNTPICDFVEHYASKNAVRAHMPGHKGNSFLGCEALDITEINGADSLFEAAGVIAESEKNSSGIFGCNSFYSAEGASLCIRAMLYLAKLWGKNDLKIIAARNCHKSFISGIALLDIDIDWLTPAGSYLSNGIDMAELEAKLLENAGKKVAVYITSPDYLGGMADVRAISDICKRHHSLLLVDNAHGAYLKFLENSLHPIDLGADICCDSAHKTLPVVTGGAYLQIKDNLLAKKAKDALNLFASSSPSYLILQSLDKANPYLHDGFKSKLAKFTARLDKTKEKLCELGFSVIGTDKLKIVIEAKKSGYFGYELAEILENGNIYCEFADKDYLVLMLTPENVERDLVALEKAFDGIEIKPEICEHMPKVGICERAVSPRDAIFAESEIINAKESLGRIFAGANIACPPAVPIVVCGEVINETAINAFEYYGIEKVCVIKQ